VSFGLSSKVTSTVTDNGSNFVKAFATFAITVQDNLELTDSEEDDFEEEVSFSDVEELMMPDQGDSQDDFTQVHYDLPPHQRCAAHTLNLIANTEVDKFLSSSTASRCVYRSAFGKCMALFNKASHSSVASDQLQGKLKRKLLVPCRIRWNSYYDAIERVVENPLDDLNELCTKIGLRTFSEREMTFLKDYCSVVKPLAEGLDILQSQKNCYYGTLLPTLFTIIKKTNTRKSELSPAIVDSIHGAIR